MKKIYLFASFLLALIFISSCCTIPQPNRRRNDGHCPPGHRKKGWCFNQDQNQWKKTQPNITIKDLT